MDDDGCQMMAKAHMAFGFDRIQTNTDLVKLRYSSELDKLHT
jgi:hypothetical protein